MSELWEWAEYDCPWSYVAAVRLRMRPFPLEVMGGAAAPPAVLEREWWLAAIQEPRPAFEPWRGETWPNLGSAQPLDLRQWQQ